MSDIIHCPFCGSENTRIVEGHVPMGDKYFKSYWVSCINCGACAAPASTIDKAKKAWNRRSRSEYNTIENM